MSVVLTRGILLFVMVAALSSCTSSGYFTQSKPLIERMDDAKILLTAAVVQIGQQTKDGIMDPDDAQDKLDQLGESRRKIKDLSRLLRLDLVPKSSIERQLFVVNASTAKIQKYISQKAQEIKK